MRRFRQMAMGLAAVLLTTVGGLAVAAPAAYAAPACPSTDPGGVIGVLADGRQHRAVSGTRVKSEPRSASESVCTYHGHWVLYDANGNFVAYVAKAAWKTFERVPGGRTFVAYSVQVIP